jgi:hypothetical protein
MFQRNDDHRQAGMFGTDKQMSEKRWQRLEASWAGTFYRDFFCRIDENIFACLFSDQPSRPNVPVNVLVAFEVLKAGHGWSDEQAYDAVCFDIQVRHALGMRDLYSDEFCLRTVYNFRRAVAAYAARTGTNLFGAVFEQVTGEQQRVYEIASRRLRMDSTQVASNIANMSRLELLATVIHRVHRALDEADQVHWASEFAPYVEKSARQYAYKLRADEPRVHLVRIGRLMARLVTELKEKYGETEAYELLKRVLAEQYLVVDEVVLHRFNEDISARSLQSPDDPEATYRAKAGRGHRGYVANVAETCDETNQVQLIVDIAVEPNSADDGEMLVDAVESLVARTDVETLYTDGGYNGPRVDEALARHGIEQVQTGIRGGTARGLGRDAFDWEVDAKGKPVAVICPGEQRGVIDHGRNARNLLARFDEAICSTCALRDHCPTDRLKRRSERVLRLTERQVHAARRVRRSRDLHGTGKNPRAAVEATVWSVKARLPLGRTPYRGRARVAMYMIASAAMVNVRRLAAAARARSTDAPEKVASACRRLRTGADRLQADVRRLLSGLVALANSPTALDAA